TGSPGYEIPPPLDAAAGAARWAVRAAAADLDGAAGPVGELRRPGHQRVLAAGAAPEPPDLLHQRAGVRGARRADVAGAGPLLLPRALPAALAGADPVGAAARRGRHRAAVHLRPAGPAGSAFRAAGAAGRVLHHGGGARPDLRGPALPGDQPRGRP